jgi:hypothetical protein
MFQPIGIDRFNACCPFLGCHFVEAVEQGDDLVGLYEGLCEFGGYRIPDVEFFHEPIGKGLSLHCP